MENLILNNMLTLQNLTKKFGGVKAVDNCSFKIEKGKITALIGPNGSGKTTIFNLISGIIQANEGKVIFNDQNLIGNSVNEISNWGISRIFQKSRLFKNLSVKDNLLLAFNNDDTKLWKNIFGSDKSFDKKSTGISEILAELGISDIGGALANEISFGQKRLVELARAILNPHELLLLDEPVAGVSPKIRNIIKALLIKMKNEGKGILLIEHDMVFTLGVSDYIIVMDAGSVIAEGAPQDIRKNEKVLEAYLGQ
jgi:ABC-type branched-subunit amino acid transport system ATPase component